MWANNFINVVVRNPSAKAEIQNIVRQTRDSRRYLPTLDLFHFSLAKANPADCTAKKINTGNNSSVAGRPHKFTSNPFAP